MEDIARALTGSLPRSGSARMLGDLQMNNNRIRNMAAGVDPNDAATVAQATGVPLGAVIDFWGNVVPEGYMLAAGQEVSRTEYAELFAVIGTNAGAGNGSTTFNLPDYRGRVGAGLDNMGGSAANRVTNAASGIAGNSLGAAGGSQTHTLTTGQMPSHSHSVTDPGHSHITTRVTAGTTWGAGASTLQLQSGQSSVSTTGITIANAGSGQAHQNMQPSIICNKILRVR